MKNNIFYQIQCYRIWKGPIYQCGTIKSLETAVSLYRTLIYTINDIQINDGKWKNDHYQLTHRIKENVRNIYKILKLNHTKTK